MEILIQRITGGVIQGIMSCVGHLLWILPYFIRRRLAWGLGGVFYWVGLRREVVRFNLELAFPADAEKRRHLERESYTQFAALVLEILVLWAGPAFALKRYATVLGVEHWQKARAQGKGVIFLANHLGNWEVMVAAGSMLHQMNVLMVTKLLKPRGLHQWVEKCRARYKVRGTYEPRTMKDILKELSSGGTVGIVLDQYAGPPLGVRVKLFGVPVGTSSAVAALVKRTGAVLLPVMNYRDAQGKITIQISPPLEWQSGQQSGLGEERPNKDLELALNTQNYCKKIEEAILAHPEQWLWIHRRFKGDLSPLRAGEWEQMRKRHASSS